MTTLNLENVKSFVESGKSLADIVNFYSMTVSMTKTEIRTLVELHMEEHDLIVPKKESKSGALKAWFLDQENPLTITKDQIKAKCIELDMKGGSVTYYINAYSLAIDLTTQLEG